MEFRMMTDLSTALKPQEISFNYDECVASESSGCAER